VTKRLARFFVVNRQAETEFSIRMLLSIVLVSAQMGLRVCPQGEAEGAAAFCGEHAIERERVLRESLLSLVGCGICERPRAPLGERREGVLLNL
jgi:hypothetical protein